jgi:hypothetical protein
MTFNMKVIKVTKAPHPSVHGWLCTASRLRRRKAVLCETPPAPRSRGGDLNLLAALEIMNGPLGR